MQKNKANIYNEIVNFLKSRNAKKISVFGSYIHNDELPGSDIDILVEFNDNKTLLDLIGIEQDLSDKLQINVDLLTEESISPYLIERVKDEMKVIYQ